jgi:general secretion pathway protein C
MAILLAALLLVQMPATDPVEPSLIGVVVSHDPDRSVAILRAAGRTRVVRPGEQAFGGRVLAVEREAVLIEHMGARLRLTLGSVAPRASTASRSQAVPAPAPQGRVMARQEVEQRLLKEVDRILAETTLVPVTESGSVAGFAITRLPEGSLLTEAGLQAGDVLMSINEIPIDSLTTLMGLWPRLQAERVLNAEVMREGRPVSLSVTLE